MLRAPMHRAAAKGNRTKAKAKAKALGARASPSRPLAKKAPRGLGAIALVMRTTRRAQPSLLALVKSGKINADTYSKAAAAHVHLTEILHGLIKEHRESTHRRQESAKRAKAEVAQHCRKAARRVASRAARATSPLTCVGGTPAVPLTEG